MGWNSTEVFNQSEAAPVVEQCQNETPIIGRGEIYAIESHGSRFYSIGTGNGRSIQIHVAKSGDLYSVTILPWFSVVDGWKLERYGDPVVVREEIPTVPATENTDTEVIF